MIVELINIFHQGIQSYEMSDFGETATAKNVYVIPTDLNQFFKTVFEFQLFCKSLKSSIEN